MSEHEWIPSENRSRGYIRTGYRFMPADPEGPRTSKTVKRSSAAVYLCESCGRSLPPDEVCGDHPDERAVSVKALHEGSFPRGSYSWAFSGSGASYFLLADSELVRWGSVLGHFVSFEATADLGLRSEQIDPDRWSYIADAPGRAHGAEVTT